MTTLTDAISTFLGARIGIVSPKTARINAQYLNSLTEFFGPAQLLETLTLNHLRAWRAWLFQRETKYASAATSRPKETGALSVYTIHGHVRTCRQFFKWLHAEEFLAANPSARLELPPLPKEPPKNIADADIEKMLKAAHKSARTKARDVALIWFLRDTGCRLGGAATACLRDLDLENGVVIVREKGRGGQHVARATFLNGKAIEALRVWLAVRPEARRLDGSPVTNALFVNLRHPHGALTPGAIYRRIKSLAKGAGVFVHSNPHAFRHGLARRMLEHGAPLGAVSRILGHSDIKVTDMFYGVYENAELKTAHARWG